MPRRTDEAPLLTQRASSTRFDTAERMEGSRKKRVLVVGAGAAGKIVHCEGGKAMYFDTYSSQECPALII